MNKMNEAQRDVLIKFMEENPKLAQNSLDPAFTKEKSRKLWQDLTSRLNSLGGAMKTLKQWKRTWTDLKMSSKKKAATTKKQMMKTGGGMASSESEEEVKEGIAGGSGSVGVNPGSNQEAHERILSIIGKTCVEGIRGIKELGVEQSIASDSEEEFNYPPLKRPNIAEDPKQPPNKRLASKKELTTQWLENSRRKVDATEKVAEALNNIAYQIGRIADSLELYNA